MPFIINFFLEIPQQNQKVYISIDGMKDPFLMDLDPHQFYKFSLQINQTEFPVTLTYKYFLENRSPIFSDVARTAIINYQPLSNLIIHDSNKNTCQINDSKQKSNIKVFIFLYIPFSAREVQLFSPFKQIGNDTRLIMKQNNNCFWSAIFDFDASLPIPFIYNYFIKKNDGTAEIDDMCHIISFNSPLQSNRASSNFFSYNCSIYDYYYKKSPQIPFYPGPINTSAMLSPVFTNFSIDYIGNYHIKNVNISLGFTPVKFHNFNNIWTGNLDFNFTQTISYNIDIFDSKGTKNSFNNPSFKLINIPNFKMQNIKIYHQENSASFFPLTFYFPLVSIKARSDDPCGSFKTISRISEFLHSIGISQIHIHIEKLLNNEIMLDPVQLSFQSNELQNCKTLDEIREKKLNIALRLYESQSTSPAFEKFKELFNNSFSQYTEADTDLFIQYLCYCDLCINTQLANQSGVQIITSVRGNNNLQRVLDSLPVISLYSSGIFLDGVGRINTKGITNEDIVSRFHDDSAFIESTFYDKKGSTFALKEIFKSNKQLLRETLQYIDVSVRDFYYKDIIDLENKEISPQQHSEQYFFNQLKKSQNFVSSAIILDEYLSLSNGIQSVITKFCIPSSSSTNYSTFTYLIPKDLTPLRFSAYLPNIDKTNLINDIKKKLQLKTSICVIYLYDFLYCLGIVNLQNNYLITGNDSNRRYLYSFAVDDLLHPETIQRAKKFISSLYS